MPGTKPRLRGISTFEKCFHFDSVACVLNHWNEPKNYPRPHSARRLHQDRINILTRLNRREHENEIHPTDFEC